MAHPLSQYMEVTPFHEEKMSLLCLIHLFTQNYTPSASRWFPSETKFFLKLSPQKRLQQPHC